MRNPFWHFTSGEEYTVIQDRRTGTKVAKNVDRAYVHRIVDLLNRDAAGHRAQDAHELLRAYE